MKTWIQFTLFFLALLSCQTKQHQTSLSAINFPTSCQGKCQIDKLTKETFTELSVDGSFGGVKQKSLKFVYMRDPSSQQGKVYFFDTRQYPYHHDFVTRGLGIRISQTAFNKHYAGSGEKRLYNLGTLILSGETTEKQKLIFEMWSGDTIENDYLHELFTKLDLSLKNLGEIYFHPLSTNQNKAGKKIVINDITRVISTEELYADRNLFVLNSGNAIGYLTPVTEDTCLDLTKIALFKKVPNDLGLVAGVITSALQTPLSHVNVKSKNRGTLNISLLNADEEIGDYKNQFVELQAINDSYSINRINSENAEEQIKDFWKSKKPKLDASPEFTLNSTFADQLLDLKQYFLSNPNHHTTNRQGFKFPTHSAYKDLIKIVGAKAANLGVLSMIMDSKAAKSVIASSPDALAVPFDFFHDFITPLETQIKTILNEENMLDQNTEHSICDVKPQLEKIRTLMEEQTESPAVIRLANIIANEIFDNSDSPIHISKTPRIRLRSSTNSEDMPGFTGAGLYRSKGVSLYKREDISRYFIKTEGKSKAKVIKKLKKTIPYVYAGVWSDRAFEEREWFSINGTKHLDIKVGLAIHRAFPLTDFTPLSTEKGIEVINKVDPENPTPVNVNGELANGVLVTTNLYDPSEYYKTYINCQHFDLAITNPPEEEDFLAVGEDSNQDYATEEILVTAYLADAERNKEEDAWKEWTYAIERSSSIREGAPVLNDNTSEMNDLKKMEIRRLAKIADTISNLFAYLNNERREHFAIDVEWKFYGVDRKLVIKQARPFVSKAPGGADNAADFRIGRTSETRPSGPIPILTEFDIGSVK